MDRLLHERSILLGMAIDNSTASAYTSATNSYLTFCKIHNIPIDPTSETLSYYIMFQSSHINPKSVESYLSGICNNLEPFFPDICSNCASALVKWTLKGALHRHGWPTKRKSPLTTAQLQSITAELSNSCDHDDMLFLNMLNTGFPGLLCLGGNDY
jgi:leucyl-tRNA synthetase